MKPLFLILLFCSLFQTSFAQGNNGSVVTDNKGLSEAEFNLAKELYLKMSQADLYKKQRKAILELIDKMALKDDMEFPATDEEYSKWISENLSKTKFKDVDEAIALKKLCIGLKDEMIKANQEVFNLLARATIDQAVEILKPDFLFPAEIDEMKE